MFNGNDRLDAARDAYIGALKARGLAAYATEINAAWHAMLGDVLDAMDDERVIARRSSPPYHRAVEVAVERFRAAHDDLALVLRDACRIAGGEEVTPPGMGENRR